MQSATLSSAFLLTNVFMNPAYGPGGAFGELKVTRRTEVLRGGTGCCGLVLGDVRKAAFTDSAKEGHAFLSLRKARHHGILSRMYPLSPRIDSFGLGRSH